MAGSKNLGKGIGVDLNHQPLVHDRGVGDGGLMVDGRKVAFCDLIKQFGSITVQSSYLAVHMDQVAPVAGGEIIDYDNIGAGSFDQSSGNIGADIAGAAGNEYAFSHRGNFQLI